MNAAWLRIFERCEKVATVLAITAVLLRCIVAPGFMLDPTAVARGELKTVICTGSGAKSLPATSDQGPVPYPQNDNELCPYAAPGNAAALADPIPLAGERLQPTFEAPAHDAAHLSAPRRNFAARAPPKLS